VKEKKPGGGVGGGKEGKGSTVVHNEIGNTQKLWVDRRVEKSWDQKTSYRGRGWGPFDRIGGRLKRRRME